jgi:hypothetical protein
MSDAAAGRAMIDTSGDYQPPGSVFMAWGWADVAEHHAKRADDDGQANCVAAMRP